MKILATLILSFLCVSASLGQSGQILWMQQPSISPDGQWIAFEYKGNIFKVPAGGGNAVPLTINNAYNGYPVWSHDGKTIAFASDRYGNFDVYTMPANGGQALRLTYSSEKDIPYDFSPDDRKVYFGSSRHDVAQSIRFPMDNGFKKLFYVPAKGGRSVMVNSAGTEYVHFNKAGSMFIFQDWKGYENDWRKHHTSAVTRDIWTYDMGTKAYTKVSDFTGEDREPVWGDGDSFYYLSERNGDQNVYRSALSNTGTVARLTQFTRDPVRCLSRSNTGVLSFTQGGDLYTLTEGAQPQKVAITVTADFNGDQLVNLPVGKASEIAVSPDAKEVAIVFRGEIFVASADGSVTKRITNTPYQERMVQFSPDGRSLLYSVENNGSWDIYKTSIVNKNEPYFYASTTLVTAPVIATPKDEFQGVYSPDGKSIAYLEERNTLKVYNTETKKTVTLIPPGVNFSYADGDQYFAWSPDGRSLLVQSNEGSVGSNEVVLIKADGTGQRINLTQSGFNDGNPQWGMKGRMMYWQSDKQGLKNLSNGAQADVYAMFFDQALWDRYNLSKEDLALRLEQDKRDSLDKKKDTVKNAKTARLKKLPIVAPSAPFEPDLKNLDARTLRLTIGSAEMSNAALSNDGEKLYYLAKYDKNYNLWVTMPRTHETKMLAVLSVDGGSLEMSKDGSALFVLAGGNILKVSSDDGKVSPVKVNAVMELDAAAERAYDFDHIWRQVGKRLFDPKLQGVDWKYYHDQYARFLPYVNNNYDFNILLSELLGELNVSHTGSGYIPNLPNSDETAALGLIYDLTRSGNGLAVADIITGGPFDVAKTKMKKGDVIDKINGTAVTAGADWASLLNHAAGKFTLVNFHDPKTNTAYQETVKPISPRLETGTLLYDRWIHRMEYLTDSLSGGRVGYVHVRSMNDASFRATFGKVLGKNIDKKALIVDTRFNGGGNLHDELVTFLSGKLYMTLHPQSQDTKGGEPYNKWTKPSCVLMSECNYSDAFLFPYAYKKLGVGKLIGMPVAGTGTAVWWEGLIDETMYFGIPMWPFEGVGENHFTENHQLEPDIKVLDEYNRELAGEDQQLIAAVNEMLKEIK